MKQLGVKPFIHKFNTYKEFANEFCVGEKDLVITNEFLYLAFVKELDIKSNLIFVEKYGTGEPSDEQIDNIINEARKFNYNRIIAVGGGSVLDIAKLLVIKDAKNALELFEKKIPLIKDKEFIMIPTTCGTGSEVTNISIAEIKSKNTKMGLAVDQLYADHAVLIPELVKGLPYKFFVTSSVDALIHAVESYVSPKSNPFTELFAIKAIEWILQGYIKIIEKGEEYRVEIIEEFVVASTYAGIAFGNTGVGAVHAMSYPLGGSYHVPHGEANYLMFTEVFKTYNRKKSNGKIEEINAVLRRVLKISDDKDVYEALAEVLDNLLQRKPLKEYGMKEEEIEKFSDSVLEKQQRLLVNNYVDLSKEDMMKIYSKLY